MKILIIEDEQELSTIIRTSLEKENFLVESASNYEEGLHKIISFEYSCILLDIGLPGGNGLDLLQKLKDLNKADGVIIISARDSVDDKVKGLALGADDYLTKPFHLAELNARVKSILRRATAKGGQIMTLGNVQVSLDERAVLVHHNQLQLNRKEFDILVYFMSNTNRLIQKSALAEHVWGDFMDEADDFEFIYSQVKNLRKKLTDAGASIAIRSVYGLGYKLTDISES